MSMNQSQNNSHCVLGIDPGSRITGYGVILISANKMTHVGHGVMTPPLDLNFAQKLFYLSEGLRELITKYKPQTLVLEKIFLGKNVDSAFKLGHVRGVMMSEASRQGLGVEEYAARQVKKGITGSGASEKTEVQLILQKILNIQQIQKIDASDALALACYHAFELNKQKVLKQMSKRNEKIEGII